MHSSVKTVKNVEEKSPDNYFPEIFYDKKRCHGKQSREKPRQKEKRNEDDAIYQ